MVFITNFLLFKQFSFFLGALGIVLNRKNILLVFMSIEILLISVNLNFVFFSIFLDDLIGQLFSLFILIVAGCESAIGLAILIAFFKVRSTIAIKSIQMLKG